MRFLCTLTVLYLLLSGYRAEAAPGSAPAPPAAVAQACAEEFNGPYASWRNVKADYRAVGNGVADDTDAIQRGLDDLRLHTDSCVLYFPEGTYRLTRAVSTLHQDHHDATGITVIGEDPATTVLKWDGPADGTMFTYDAWYSTISRLTLDGQGKAAVALAYGPFFSTYNETSDMIFKDVEIGLQMGTTNVGQAENAVLRCQFLRCSDKGLVTNDWNSLDIWAWYCRFEDCGYAMYGNSGNFHAYQNLFLRSRKADIGSAHLMVFSFINNTSIGSNCFLDFTSGHAWGSATSVTGNRVIEPTGPWALRLGNAGPYFVAHNVIKSRPEQTGPVVEMTWGSQTFLGNTYTVQNPVKEAGRFLRINDDKLVDPATISSELPALPPTPPHRQRQVFEVAAGADAATIQVAIDSAAALRGQRPVVHLAMGLYKIGQTLTIPAGCDVQLVGDGGMEETGTSLEWTGPEGETLLHLPGPSVATVRDLYMRARYGNCILVDNADQQGGRIFTDQLNAYALNGANPSTGVLVNGLGKSDVLMSCLQGGTDCETWVKVIGSPQLVGGQGPRSQVSIFCGATGTAQTAYAVEKGGRLVVRSVYHEKSGGSPQALRLNDAGMMAIDATKFSYRTTAEQPLVAVDNFRGSLALLTSLMVPVVTTATARTEITGNGADTDLLMMNDIFWLAETGITSDSVFHNNANPPARAALVNCSTNSILKDNEPSTCLDDRGEADPQWVAQMVQPLLDARIWLPGTVPAGATNVRFHRVICTSGKGMVDVEFRAGK